MNRLKRLLRRLSETTFAISAGVSTLTIVLISVFVFGEGLGLFSSPAVEEHYGLYVHRDNPVRELSVEDCKRIFDHEVTNWQSLTGVDAPITIISIDDIVEAYSEEELGADYQRLPECILRSIEAQPHALAFLPEQYIPDRPLIKPIDMGTIKPSDFFGGKSWMPTSLPAPLLGALPLILGTLFVSFIAIVIALPVGLAVAIYLSEIASPLLLRLMRPALELLAGIPSVVYGFWGLTVLVPWIQSTWSLPVGETALAGGLILSVMALPTIISVAHDAIRSIPHSLREASLALGASRWQSIRLVVLPAAHRGIAAAVVLGIGRAVGETMAVLMVTGNAAVMPESLFQSVRTIPATIAAELGEVSVGSPHYQALFALGAILFVMTMGISLISELIARRSSPATS